MTMRAVGSVPSGEGRNTSAASAPMPSAGMPAPPLRPLDPDTGPMPSPDARSGIRPHPSAAPAKLDAAVHMARRKWIFVTDHDDPTTDAVGVPLEILRSAQTEIEDFRHNARRRRRAQKRRAWKRHARHRMGQLRSPAPPTGIFHRLGTKRCAGHCRQPLLREIKSRGFARRAGEPAAEIAQRQEVRPHLRVAGTDRWNRVRPMLRRSLGADPDRLDDIGPALRVALDQGSKLRGRGMGCRDA